MSCQPGDDRHSTSLRKRHIVFGSPDVIRVTLDFGTKRRVFGHQPAYAFQHGVGLGLQCRLVEVEQHAEQRDMATLGELRLSNGPLIAGKSQALS